MLDPNLFPPEFRTVLNDNYGTKKSGYLRQVRYNLDNDALAVTNCTMEEDGTWGEPHFVVLRGVLSPHEIEFLESALKAHREVFVKQMPVMTEEELRDCFGGGLQ